MLTRLTIENFKPFETQAFTLKPLTLLSGLNSTGKSSVLQSLLLLRQSYEQDLLDDVGLALNGDLVSIGTAQDALFERAKDDLMAFEIILDQDLKSNWIFEYDRKSDIINKVDSLDIDQNIYQSSLFNDNFHYLRADRISPRNYFEISDFQVQQHQQLGIQGEFTVHFLSIHEYQTIPNKNLSYSDEITLNLKNQVEAWMGEISPGTRIEIESHPTMDLVNLQYSYGLSNPYRSTNVGFGITYTLPIIVALLSAKSETLILLENPEAHLHPRGQSKMGELIALACSGGVQVIVETHSDHILNGIRLAVHRGKISPDDIQLHYFQRLEKKREWVTEIISPKIDRNGRIDQWPDGFFDEWDKSLEELLETIGE